MPAMGISCLFVKVMPKRAARAQRPVQTFQKNHPSEKGVEYHPQGCHVPRGIVSSSMYLRLFCS